ncbi:MAG: hypothetical protein ORN58_02985 [Sediminibacterium sp.]|nr:hypothetical protein [Sediminibacterium sp.]
MKYKVVKNDRYDFKGQSYSTKYPNLHKYPATMLPQIGIELLNEFNIKSGKLLDPYCGTGSSFIAGLHCNLTEMKGYDLNPLAVLVSKAKFTKINIIKAKEVKQALRNNVYDFIKTESNIGDVNSTQIKNIDFWFSKNVVLNLSILKHFLYRIKDTNIQQLFLVPFSETVRDCSYTRNNEFKLFKIKPADIIDFNPDVFGIFFQKLNKVIDLYEYFYLPKLNNKIIDIEYKKFEKKADYFDVVLTSPPYGDSKTTVAYGQFSNFANEWLDIDYARKIDSFLMGGVATKINYQHGIIADSIVEINKQSPKRAKEVSAFYFDLEHSIITVANSVKKGGLSMYVVGNRTVKNTLLQTDQFIAEKFEENGFKHITTFERILGNKSMPSKNSPSNKIGKTVTTMLTEYIVVCEKII